ncbi:MAG: dGTPase [Saprospiraceae bacterium]|jgi:dGTPase
MMQWDNCYSNRRTGMSKTSEIPRTEYQRDYDRLIFASSFRRLQNKTQVFPLPGSTFVHNRLTHSLEVASVGRTLGTIIGRHLSAHVIDPTDYESLQFYQFDLASVLAAACLAHDIGNPAFGHSGEKAISNYFIENAKVHIEGKPLRSYFNDLEWTDLITFEGNANALRVLTHPYRDKPISGMGLTYTTLAAILKYPCESKAIDKRYKHRKKYGFFQSEKETFLSIMEELNMYCESQNPIIFRRHPFVYLVEAADDICYRVIDMEDAHRIGIIGKAKVSDSFLSIIRDLNRPNDNIDQINSNYNAILDANDSISYLRAKTINSLTNAAAETFLNHQEEILKGTWDHTLIDFIEESSPALSDIMTLSRKEIYNHHSVIEIEITGFHVMSHLLNLFVPAVLRKRKQGTDRMALRLIPYQFTEYEITERPYLQVLSVVDFISGMTDSYATEFYRKTTGIDISKHV